MDFPIIIIWMSPFSLIFFLGGGIKSNFSFLFHFSMKFMKANRITPGFAASYLGLLCLPLAHKKDDRLIWVK